MDTSPKESLSNDEEVLHTFTILEIHNGPDNTSSCELVMFLDAPLAHSSAPSVIPTFLEYHYNQMDLANRDSILRLLVRDVTPQEDTNYYDMTSELLSSDLLRDHECGLLASHPCADEGWLKWLQDTTLLIILPPRKVPVSYWARLQPNKKDIKGIPAMFRLPLRRVF